MKKKLIYMAALVMLAVACNNEDNPFLSGNENNGTGEVKMITETITATSGDANGTTRADVDAYAKFTWSKYDKIAVHVSDGKYYTTDALAEGEGGSNSADFSVSYPEGKVRDGFAIFPASIVAPESENYGQEGRTLDVTLPSSYTLAEVSGTTTPCPMIAANTPGSGWEFKQICGLLRLTVNEIPDDATYLLISFGGYQVCGDFSIASPNSDEPTLSTSAITGESPTNAGDRIRITDLGGNTSITVNIPLPAGQYNGIIISAWNSSNVKVQDLAFSYTAKRAKGKKMTTSLTGDSKSIITGSAITPSTSDKAELESVINFNFKNGSTNAAIENIRFVRIFSGANKLQAEYKEKNATTFGPVTLSKGNEETDNLPNSFYLGLRFDDTPNDLIAFQVIDKDGTVYSGSITAPNRGYENGYFYNETVNVNTYTFTVASDKKVYFSPGDLGVDGGVYSFTKPFETWGWKDAKATKRVWFNYNEISSGLNICGIDWRNPNTLAASSSNSPRPQEWDNIIGRKNMNSDVAPYYRVTVAGHANCLLLPPDETHASDIGEDITSGTVTDYAKYLGKGFVLLISTGRALYWMNKYTWSMDKQGWYWALWHKMGTNRTYFQWYDDTSTPAVTWASNQFRMRVRYVRDVTNEDKQQYISTKW